MFTTFLGFFFQRQQSAIIFISVAIVVSINFFHQFRSSLPWRFWRYQKQNISNILQAFSRQINTEK